MGRKRPARPIRLSPLFPNRKSSHSLYIDYFFFFFKTLFVKTKIFSITLAFLDSGSLSLLVIYPLSLRLFCLFLAIQSLLFREDIFLAFTGRSFTFYYTYSLMFFICP